MQVRFAYIAVPHTAPSQDIEQERFEAVTELTGLLMSLGMRCFSPISHTHPIYLKLKEAGITLEHSDWLEQDKAQMLSASVLVVCTLPGWEKSVGVQKEIALFEKTHRPVLYIQREEWERMT